jgi:hypothetical protein
MIDLPSSLTGIAPQGATPSKGFIDLPPALTGISKSAPTAAPARTSPSVPSYGPSAIPDQSGKPLETFNNPKAAQTQLLKDRVYPGFDPTVPQKLDPSHLENGRMPLAGSAPLKEKMGGAYSDELDHAIALELSGSNDRSNLQIEPGRTNGGVSAQHDQLENKLAKDVVNGDKTGVSLLDAQRQIAKAKGRTLLEDGPAPASTPAPTPATFSLPKLGKNNLSNPDTAAPTAGEELGSGALAGFPGTMQAIADLQTNPLSLHSSFKDIISTPFKDMTEASDRFNETLGATIKGFQNHEGAAANANHVLETATAFTSSALSPITSMFNAASKLPVAGTLTKLLFNIPFALAGDVTGDNGVVALEGLQKAGVISPDTAKKLEPGVRDFAALVGQIALGKGADLLERGLAEKVGPEEASQLVKHAEQVVKDSPSTPTEPAAAAGHPSPAPVEFPEKPLPETKGAPTAERAGFVNPEAFTDSAKEALAKYQQATEDTKAGEALRTYFTGERDSRVAETNQLRDQLSKGLSSQEQEALTLMRDFKNKPGELDAFANGTHEAYGKLPPTERAAAIERVQTLKPIIDLAKNPTENMKAADAAMTDYFTKHLAEGKQLGFLDSKIGNDEYISHLLQPKEDAGKVVARNGGLRTYKIGRRTPFSNERTYPTVLHAIANGVEPRTLNALDALTIYGDKHATAAATHLLINQLKDSGVAKWGSHGSENIPADWQPVAPESRLFQNQVPFADKEGKPGIAHQSLFAPQKVVDALRPLTDPDYTSRIPGFTKSKLYQAYLKSVELGLSVFHLRALNLSALGNEGLTGLVKTYASDLKSPAFLENERAFIKAGGTSSILGRTIEAYRELQPSSIPTRMDLLRSMPVLKQFDQASARISKLTFDIVQRKMKVTDFALKDAKWIADHPEATPADHYTAQRSIAKEINATYGGLNWESLGINKMTHSLLRAVLLAPDWTFSNWQNAKAAFQGGPGGSAARAFWIRSAITGVILTEATSVLLSGKRSQDPSSVYLGKDKNGKDIYQNLFFSGAPGDMVNLIKNVQDLGPIAGLGQTLLGKLSPILKTGEETVTNKNYLGQDVVPKGSGFVAGAGRSAVNIAESLGPVPFSLTNITQMLMDPKKQYTEKEFVTTLLGGTRPRHVVPSGMRQVTSGKKKGQLAPQPPRQKNSALDIIKGRPVYKPTPKK